MTRQVHPLFPKPVLGFSEPLSLFSEDFLKRARQAVLAPTQSFSLKGLHAYWQRTDPERSAWKFQDQVWLRIEQAISGLDPETTAVEVRSVLSDMMRYSTVAGPLWMEATAHNELIGAAIQALEDLVDEALESALAVTPVHALEAPHAGVQHEVTQACGVVLSASSFDRFGLAYDVLVESEPTLQHWPVTACHVL
jgi:hypothetical protein